VKSRKRARFLKAKNSSQRMSTNREETKNKGWENGVAPWAVGAGWLILPKGINGGSRIGEERGRTNTFVDALRLTGASLKETILRV